MKTLSLIQQLYARIKYPSDEDIEELGSLTKLQKELEKILSKYRKEITN